MQKHSKKSAVKIAATKAQAPSAAYNAAIAACATNAHKTAQPGIIASIMQQLVAAKLAKAPVSVAHILTVLQKQFPLRTRTGMQITVRAQLSRLPKQRNFPIVKTRSGRQVVYAAK